MKFTLLSLKLALRETDEEIDFPKLSYFWGQMGAGKSSIARLIDYCLGGIIQLSPALQAEFVSATLTLELERSTLRIERQRDTMNVFASWVDDQKPYSVVIPAREAAGEVLPQTGVETLSDLVFWLSNIKPPRVRKSKAKADSKIVRLSLRDLLWYCYLDQDHIDSSFFYLEESAEFYMRLKSRDVIRYVIGYHDERVADLEAELDQLRANRTARIASIDSLSKALTEIGIESEAQVAEREVGLRIAIARVDAELTAFRNGPREAQTTHATDELAQTARGLGIEIAQLDLDADELRSTHNRNVRHRNELDILSLKFRRSAEAREILGDVAFTACPRCSQALPQRAAQCCDVCGQEDLLDVTDPAEVAELEADIASRRGELNEVITAIENNLGSMQAHRATLLQTKDKAEADINRALAEHDSAFLSMSLLKERRRAALEAELASIAWLLRLPMLLQQQRDALAQIIALELTKREALKDARTKAEEDRTSLDRFADYFLDCLVLSGVPGIRQNDHVELEPPSFYPVIFSADPADLTVSTFTSLSSGGKKTLFKCCFAIALHRIATQLNAPLPELLIIDSPMKNISERENKAQFEGFYRMLYRLNAEELLQTQFVLIDKEFFPPTADLAAGVTNRHMQPDSEEHQPLIRYYRGK